MRGFAVRAGAVASWFSSIFATLEVTDFLQNGETAGRTMGTVAVGDGTALHLRQGDLQARQRVLAVPVRVSVVPGRELRSCEVAEVAGG